MDLPGTRTYLVYSLQFLDFDTFACATTTSAATPDSHAPQSARQPVTVILASAHVNQSLRLVSTGGLIVLVAMGVVFGAPGPTEQRRLSPMLRPELEQQLTAFVTAKKQQAETVLANAKLAKPVQFDDLFAAMAKGDSQSASNRYQAFDQRFRNRPTGSGEMGMVWQIVMEAHTGWNQFHEGNPDLMEKFGRDIMAVIPEGSIYFGGTDMGRFVVTALCESHAEGRPFFTITQNQLADARYLNYLRHLYGSRLTIPSEKAERAAFDEYVADFRERQKQGRVGPEEKVSVNWLGRVSASGVGSTMAVNGLLVKRIVEQNPQRDYFIEESYPIAWLYPRLEPLGPILRIGPEPMRLLNEEAVRQDRKYWENRCGEFLGDWIKEETSVEEVCAFGVRVYLQKQLKGFRGSDAYVQDPYAQKAFSKLRSSIAAVYKWRSEIPVSETDRQWMLREADLGFRQALALCPYSPEAVWHYHALLTNQGRTDDARLVRQTALEFVSHDPQLREWFEQLKAGEAEPGD